MDGVKGLKIIHLNIRGLVPKIDLFQAWVYQYKPDIIALSETLLTNRISNNEIKLTNHVLYRADRALGVVV